VPNVAACGWIRASLIVAALVLVAPTRALAEILPGSNPYGDAADVDLIVEGRVIGEDRVEIGRTLFSAKPLGEGVREITVEGLAKHDRSIRDGFEATGTLEASDVVLLLDRAGDGGTWRPHHLFLVDPARSGRRDGPPGGAAGTFWLKDGAVWGYAQHMNPGPLFLTRWRRGAARGSGREELLREIEAGLAARRAWESDLGIADPAERARRLLRWLQDSTSPDGERRTIRRWAVRPEMKKIGAAAVPALISALDPAVTAEARREALCALADLGPAARDAIPRLLELATDPAGQSPATITYALCYAGDERAVPALRRFLAEAPLSDSETLRHAAEGLIRWNDPEAGARIASRLPEDPDPQTAYVVLDLVERLRRIDPAAARAWLTPRASLPLFASSETRVESLLRTEPRRVDLVSLAARTRSPKEGGDWSAVFPDLLALRDAPVEDAVPVLTRVLLHERGNDRIFRFAAAQALYALGGPKAHAALKQETSSADFDGRLAFDYAFDWNMEPRLRDGFLLDHVLTNAGEAPTVKVRVPTGAPAEPHRLAFDVEVRNDLTRPLEMLNPEDRAGELLVFRKGGGHVVRTSWPGTCEHMDARSITLAPGATRSVRVTVEIVSPESVLAPASSWAPPNGVGGRCGGYVYLLGTPGDYEVRARWTSRTGRSVSEPVPVVIPSAR
jgi:hypothetical protein